MTAPGRHYIGLRRGEQLAVAVGTLHQLRDWTIIGWWRPPAGWTQPRRGIRTIFSSPSTWHEQSSKVPLEDCRRPGGPPAGRTGTPHIRRCDVATRTAGSRCDRDQLGRLAHRTGGGVGVHARRHVQHAMAVLVVRHIPTARYSASQRYRRPRLELAGRALGIGQMQALASAAKSWRAPATISASTFGSA